MRKPDVVSHDEYVTFYKGLGNDWDEHGAVKHVYVEGQLEFKVILFTLKRAPFNMFGWGSNKMHNHIKFVCKENIYY